MSEARATGLSAGMVVDGRYRVDAPLGQGGYGAVYVATQLNLNRRVALKVLHAEVMLRPNARERFEREAQLAQQLSHPNVVRLFDFGVTGGLPYIVFELLDGRSLEQEITARGPLSPARAARVTAQVLKALAEAHARGIVHRDIKPGNIFLSDFAGEPDFVKVLDFGIAAGPRAEGKTGLTQEGISLGTPAYMAPEQVLDEPIDGRADLYALGLVMSEMLSGSMVFQGTGAMVIAMQQIAATPVPHHAHVLEGPLGPVIARATQKDRSWRFSSALEMLERLNQVSAITLGEGRAAVLDPTTSTRTPQYGQPAVSSVRVLVEAKESGAVASRPTQAGETSPSGPNLFPTHPSVSQQQGASQAPNIGASSMSAQFVPPQPAPPKKGIGIGWIVALSGIAAASLAVAGTVIYFTQAAPAPSKKRVADAEQEETTAKKAQKDEDEVIEEMVVDGTKEILRQSFGSIAPRACGTLEIEKTWSVKGLTLSALIRRAEKRGFRCTNHAATAPNRGVLSLQSDSDGSFHVHYGPEATVKIMNTNGTGQQLVDGDGNMLLLVGKNAKASKKLAEAIASD